MKSFVRNFVLTAAAVSSLALLCASPALAKDDTTMVQTAQMRLASLGYYVGRYDGMMGPMTSAAIADFQRSNGLLESGRLTTETYSLLGQKEYLTHYAYAHDVYPDSVAYSNYDRPVVAWDDRWYHVHTTSLPFRYGNLVVTEDDRAGLRHYTVTLNGESVIVARNQPNLLRVSQTFHMNNEDAVIFTAYNDDGACAYRSYLFTMRSDGTHGAAREINNCANAYEAHVTNGALFISFSESYVGDRWSTWDVWRYDHGALVRI